MSVEGKIYAVLTGDLVNSSRLTSELSRQAMQELKSASSTFNAAFPGTVHGEMDTFRYDSWQLLIDKPMFAFRATLFLRCVLKMNSSARIKYDIRVSIGIGEVDFVAENRISVSRGTVFTISGKGLDSMKNALLAFDGAFSDPLVWSETSLVVMPLLDCVVSDWTPVGSGVVSAALLGKTQAETVDYLLSKQGDAPTRRAVSDSLSRAHWSTVSGILAWAEEKMGRLPDFC